MHACLCRRCSLAEWMDKHCGYTKICSLICLWKVYWTLLSEGPSHQIQGSIKYCVMEHPFTMRSEKVYNIVSFLCIIVCVYSLVCANVRHQVPDIKEGRGILNLMSQSVWICSLSWGVTFCTTTTEQRLRKLGPLVDDTTFLVIGVTKAPHTRGWVTTYIVRVKDTESVCGSLHEVCSSTHLAHSLGNPPPPPWIHGNNILNFKAVIWLAFPRLFSVEQKSPLLSQ